MEGGVVSLATGRHGSSPTRGSRSSADTAPPTGPKATVKAESVTRGGTRKRAAAAARAGRYWSARLSNPDKNGHVELRV